MEKKNLKITISGGLGGGKTYAMNIIVDALAAAGYEIGKRHYHDLNNNVPIDQEVQEVSADFSARAKRGPKTQSNKPESPKLWYSIKEACQASTLGRTTLYNHMAAGRLRTVRVGGRTIIPAEALHALLAGEG